jgi:hypothetical protein
MKAEQNELITRVGPGTAAASCCAATGSRWRWWTNSTPRWTRA